MGNTARDLVASSSVGYASSASADIMTQFINEPELFSDFSNIDFSSANSAGVNGALFSSISVLGRGAGMSSYRADVLSGAAQMSSDIFNNERVCSGR